MKRVSSIVFALCFAVAGCTSSSTTSSDSTRGTESSNRVADDSRPDPKNPKKAVGDGKRANPLVGRWTVTKSSEIWAEHVSKKAIIEFVADGQTPNTGMMKITNNNNITADAGFMWQGTGFVFEAKFEHPDGMRNGCAAQVKIEKLTDNEIVGDYFTLKRIP